MKLKASEKELMQAAYLGDISAISAALRNGANVNCTGELEHYESVSPLMLAVKSGNVAAVRLLISKKAKANLKARSFLPGEPSRETALHWAVRGKQLAVCHLLIRAGADVNAECTHGTVVHYAIRTNDSQIIKLLLDSGGSFDKPSGVEKNCPIHVAARDGNAKTIELLCSMGARIVPHPLSGITPLMEAAVRGCCGAVKALLKLGDEINARDAHGWSPLMWAVQGGDEACIKAILRLKPEVDARTKDGKTAWDLAQDHRNPAAAYWIERAGGKPEVQPNLPGARFFAGTIWTESNG